MVSISKRVYVDDPAQPSEPGSTSGATISVANQKHLFFGKCDGLRPPLKMTIREPRSLGLKSFDGVDLNEFVGRVLTACNLLLKNTRLSTDAADTEPVGIISDMPPDTARAENESGKMTITVRDTIAISDHAEYRVISHEDLDEVHVREVLDMIHAVYDNSNTSAKVANLRASLESYSHGIVAHHRDEVLKGLYVALEKAVNFDKNVADTKFDSKTRVLVGDPALGIDRIRRAYNRLKHPTSVKQLPDYPDQLDVFRFVKELRPAAAKAILRRLNDMAGKP